MPSSVKWKGGLFKFEATIKQSVAVAAVIIAAVDVVVVVEEAKGNLPEIQNVKTSIIKPVFIPRLVKCYNVCAKFKNIKQCYHIFAKFKT